MIDWLNTHLRPNGDWNGERVILFTEYRATQKWLHDLLAHQGFAANGRLLMIYGGMPHDDREKIKAAFQADPHDAGADSLATDAASEGLNLQNYCSRLIHYEIPWNPNRMEQRNGRVDRLWAESRRGAGLSLRRRRLCPGAHERQEGRGAGGGFGVLMRAALKVETIREDLGKVGPVIAAQVEEAMLGKRREAWTPRRPNAKRNRCGAC